MNGLQRRMRLWLKSKGIEPIGNKKRQLRRQVAELLLLKLPVERKAQDRMVAKAIGFRAEIVVSKPPKHRPVHAFYDSDEWRELRYRALKLHGGSCQCCGNRASPGKPLHVDHIKPRSKFPELELQLSNLQVLCKDCNLGKMAWDETDWRDVKTVA